MWLCTNDAFLSIVSKDCPDGSLLVRARRPGDIEKVFGRRTKVTRSTDSDYLYRAVISRDEVITAMQREVLRVDYGNFKDSVVDEDLHDAYMKVWCAMAALQNPRPYSEVYRGKWMGSPLAELAVHPVMMAQAKGAKKTSKRHKKAALQNPRPYSEVYKRPLTNEAIVNALPSNGSHWNSGGATYPKQTKRKKRSKK